MPLVGTAALLATARLAAEDVVKARWLARKKVLSTDELAQMRLEFKQADSEAILTFLITNTVVTVAVTGAVGVGTIG